MATLDSILKVVLDIQTRVSALEAGGAGGSAPAPSSGGASGSAEPAALSPAVKAYDEFVTTFVSPLVASSKAMACPEGDKIGDFLDQAFNKYTRDFIYMSSQNKKPKSTDLGAWKDELGAIVKAVNTFKDSRSPFINLMSALAEAVQCLSWVFQDGPTAPFIENFLDGTLFWSNKVLVIKKKEGEAGAVYVKWCGQFKDMLQNLIKYCKAHATTGIVYNPKGGSSYTKGGAPAAPTASAAATPTPVLAAAPKVESAPAVVMDKGSIFAGIQGIDQSSGKTAGLRKVENSEKTYKNAELRESSVVKAKEPLKKEAAAKPASLKLAGTKWNCEYQVGACEIITEGTKQEVYVFGCVGAVITVKGKFKSIVIDGCKKTALVMDSVISTVEVVNCKNQKVQVLGNVPAVAVDKTDGFQVYLSKDSHHTQIVTSKCSDMNANFEMPDGEWKEYPIPEQFVSKFAAEKLTTTISDLYH